MLKDQNPQVLAAITNIVVGNREQAAKDEQKITENRTSKYSAFKPLSNEPKVESLQEELSPKQKKIAKVAGHPKKIDSADFAALRSGAKVEEASKLDPVGKEDHDVDNDGDSDKSDSYLKNRRKKISAAIKEAMDKLDEARGRPRKNPVAAGGDDDGKEPDQHIHVQLKKAADMGEHGTQGGSDIKFDNGSHFVKGDHAKKVLSALEKLKPADREKMHAHIQQSHANFQAVHKLVS